MADRANDGPADEDCSQPRTTMNRVSPDLESLRGYLIVVARARMGADLLQRVTPADLVQETLLDAERGWSGFKGKCENDLRNWLWGILNNRILKARRYHLALKRNFRKEVPWEAARFDKALIDPATPASEFLRRSERNEALKKAFATLDERDQRVIRWYVSDKLSFAEIALLIGRSEDAARKVWARALLKLKAKLGSGYAP